MEENLFPFVILPCSRAASAPSKPPPRRDFTVQSPDLLEADAFLFVTRLRDCCVGVDARHLRLHVRRLPVFFNGLGITPTRTILFDASVAEA
jgi:hypothetical protein